MIKFRDILYTVLVMVESFALGYAVVGLVMEVI